LFITDSAKDDLVQIWQYINTNNPKAAEKLMRTFQEKFELLRDFPKLGRERHELFIGSRSFPVGKYIIIYQPQNEILEIVRVRHSATNLDELFDV
jgi:toxin ParE1/3/4